MSGRTLTVIACVWIAGVAYVAGTTWPVFPLDMPAGDPQVRAAYESAMWAHVIRYALVALIPAAAIFGVAWTISRRKKSVS